ncbi:MAG TPA: trypsin-like peptidase domain-containing protein [Symbiobacteriaceae bacterium]|jgi:S1-C subfamily serine protease|nr:trypsin-like peptidase domain-containing protein [Symbiobacteriaceae bacterium]
MLHDDKENIYENGAHNEQPSAPEEAPAVETAQTEVAGETAAVSEPVPQADPVMQLPEIPVTAAPAAPPFYPEAPQAPASKKSGSGWKLFAAALALVGVGAAAGGATSWAVAKQYMATHAPIGVTASMPSNLKAIAETNAEVAASVIPSIWQKVSPSVVKLEVESRQGTLRGSGTGSGFVVDSAGYIMTNHHVIDGATSIKVKFVDGTVLDGKVTGSDPYKDVAVVKVDPGTRPLVAAELGDSEKVQVGELAVAIGNPFGQEFTVTAGIVSAINRTLNETNINNPIFEIPGGIQTDAAINPGNSGGPLLNANGQVVGINTLIDTGDTMVEGNLGIGFAVPINLAKELLPALKEGKSVGYAFLGVEPLALSKQVATQLGIDATEGIVVQSVTEGSAAEKAGLQEPVRLGRTLTADVITAIDGKPMTSENDLYRFMASKKPGDVVKITVLRGKEQLELTATLGERPLE